MPELRVSFEPSDIVNEVMSFGSPTPIEIAVSGPNMKAIRDSGIRIGADPLGGASVNYWAASPSATASTSPS